MTKALPKIFVLQPFLAKGSLALTKMRELRRRNFDVHLAFYLDALNYPQDLVEDFAAEGRVVDFRDIEPTEFREILIAELRRREIDIILQIGGEDFYRELPAVRTALPHIRIVDMLYNEVGHVVNHFLYEDAFDGVIVESLYMRQHIEQCSMKSRTNVIAVESGIDLKDLYAAERRPQSGSMAVAYIGRMSPEKNPFGFVDIAERLAPKFPEMTFRMFGPGPLEKDVRARVAASNAGQKITFDGFAEHVRDALHKIDVLIVPSTLDGRPNIIMEASACGVPVLGAPVGGIPELIVEGENGFLVSPQDYEKFASVFSSWIREPALYQRMRNRARQIAELRFDRSSMMDRYANAIARFASA